MVESYKAQSLTFKVKRLTLNFLTFKRSIFSYEQSIKSRVTGAVGFETSFLPLRAAMTAQKEWSLGITLFVWNLV